MIMEKSNVSVTDQPYHGEGNNSSAANAAAASQSAINISTSIHLEIPVPSAEGRKCKHFQIRQYVDDIRGKDPRLCLPFSSEGDSEQLLPPMVVPQSKYWSCKNCLYGNGDIRHLEEVVLISENEMEIPEYGSADSDFDRAVTLSLATDKTDKCPEYGSADSDFDHALALSLATDKTDKCTEYGSADSDFDRAIALSLVTDKTDKCNEVVVTIEMGHQIDILGFTVPKRKRKASYRQEKKPMEEILPGKQRKIAEPSKGNADIFTNAIVISSDSDSDSDAVSARKVDGVAVNHSKESGKLAQFGGRKTTKVPWKEVINKNNHTEITAGTSSSKSKKDLTPMRKIEPKPRGRMPQTQQRERTADIPSHKDGKDHGKTGCGVISSTAKGERNIFYKDFTRKFNFCAGESSVSHHSTNGPSLAPTLKNYNEVLACTIAKEREQGNHLPLVQNKDSSGPNYNEKSSGIPKLHEALKLNSDYRAHKGLFDAFSQSTSQHNVSNAFLSNFGPIRNVVIESSAKRTPPVEYEFFPKAKGTTLDSSPFQNDENARKATPVPVKLFGNVLEQGKPKRPYARADNRTEVCGINKNPADIHDQ